jgi:hypothetical protein
MRFVYHGMASRPLIIVTAALLTVLIAVGSGMFFFTANNAVAHMTGNANSGMNGPNGMMGMGPGMMGMGPGMMGHGSMMGPSMGMGMTGMGPGMMGPGMGMMGMGPGMMAGNQSMMRGMMMQMMGAEQNVTGSINLSSTILNAIASQVKTSLSEAASTAEGAVGNNSHAVAAHIGMTNGYLTYCVLVLGPDMNMNMVIVDHANGQVLLNRAISMQHLTMMGMGPGMMGMGPGMMW